MKHLRLRLTGLYTITAGLILTLAMAGFLMLRVRETRQDQLEDFHNTWNAVVLRLQSDSVISQSFLAQTEAVSQSVIHIEENGIPFLYQGSWHPPTPRQTLIDRAKAMAGEEGIVTSCAPVSASSLTSRLFLIDGDSGELYYARVLVLAYPDKVRSLCLLTYLPPVLHSLKETILVLCILEITGILCLLLISWHFVGWSLRPVEESHKKQTEFIAAASHELRSPLAVLRSAISAILAEPKKQERLLRSMDSECIRMSRLIDDMLLLAAADSGTWSIRPQKTDMDTLLIETYEAFLPVCREKQITLRLQLPEAPLPCLLADPERIRQILCILLDNALCHTPEGKTIEICACVADDSVPTPVSGFLLWRFFRSLLSAHSASALSSENLILQVRDQGRGIPRESQPYIFDRFYRVDKARSGKTHFGLGLCIARELTVLHQGTIAVADNPGGGACFTVTLPVRDCSPA